MYMFNEYKETGFLHGAIPVPAKPICVISSYPDDSNGNKEELVNSVTNYLSKIAQDISHSIRCDLLFFPNDSSCSLKANCVTVDQNNVPSTSASAVSDDYLYDFFNKRVIVALDTLQNDIRSYEDEGIQTLPPLIILLVEPGTVHISKQVSDRLRSCLLFTDCKMLVGFLNKGGTNFLKENHLDMCKTVWTFESVEMLLDFLVFCFNNPPESILGVTKRISSFLHAPEEQMIFNGLPIGVALDDWLADKEV